MGNNSLNQFIDAAGKLLLADRPDLFTDFDDAVKDMSMAFADLSGIDPDDEEEYSVHFSGYVLTRVWMAPGLIEYTLSKKLVGFAADDTGSSHVFDWSKGGKLIDLNLNLPELEEELDIEPNLLNDIYYEDDEEE